MEADHREHVKKALEEAIPSISSRGYGGIAHIMYDALTLLKEQPEIVRCKDCKHLIDHYGFIDDGYCKKMREDYNAKLKPKKDWFCADGERR